MYQSKAGWIWPCKRHIPGNTCFEVQNNSEWPICTIHSVSILLGRTESELNALARLGVVKCISKASVVSHHLHRIVEWLLLQRINSCVNLVILLDTCKLFADGAIWLLVAGEARVERREESWHKLSLARHDVTHLRMLQMPPWQSCVATLPS